MSQRQRQRQRRWERFVDLVTQLTIPDKLRNCSHDVKDSELQLESDLDSIRNSCDVLQGKNGQNKPKNQQN